MKNSLKIAAFTALSLSATQALAFETEIESAGMLYINIPLNTHSVPKMDKTVMGLRFGQTRTSTDSVGSLFNYFRKRPALFDVQFGFVGHKNSPDDIHFGLLDLKLTGISSIEKTYINGQAVVGGLVLSNLAMGAAAVGGIAVAAAASGSGDDDADDDSSSESSSKSDDDKNDDVAENEAEHEEENEQEHEDEAEDEHEEENENHDEAENEEEHHDDDVAENEHDGGDDGDDGAGGEGGEGTT